MDGGAHRRTEACKLFWARFQVFYKTFSMRLTTNYFYCNLKQDLTVGVLLIIYTHFCVFGLHKSSTCWGWRRNHKKIKKSWGAINHTQSFGCYERQNWWDAYTHGRTKTTSVGQPSYRSVNIMEEKWNDRIKNVEKADLKIPSFWVNGIFAKIWSKPCSIFVDWWGDD